MSTAHRPALQQTRGGEVQGGFRSIAPSQKYSSRDVAAHTVLKVRGEGQHAPSEVSRRDLKRELEAREFDALAQRRKLGDGGESRELHGVDGQTDALDVQDDDEYRLEEIDKDIEIVADESVHVATVLRDHSNSRGGDDGGDDDHHDDDDDDDDDEKELMRELGKIREEREAERARNEREQEEAARHSEHILLEANPLLVREVSHGSTQEAFRVQRRWDDDVVFRNQASRGEQNPKPRFINDTIRNDFHRRFLRKYMK
mmetsp:Transcript_11401/g.23075  ORF Transcript_11401/g.23075 Transcript_11401/m.23075 type:complete len:258 (+) Transcript_11401:3861-4634(+)